MRLHFIADQRTYPVYGAWLVCRYLLKELSTLVNGVRQTKILIALWQWRERELSGILTIRVSHGIHSTESNLALNGDCIE